jgi:hypothetical protein
MERKLVNTDTAVAIRQRHQKEIGNVKSNGEASQYAKNLSLRLIALVSEKKRKQDHRAEYNEQVEKMPLVKKSYFIG